MKNLKHAALGLIAGAMAIGFSSFTNSPKKLAGDWYLPKTTIPASSPGRLDFSNYDPASQMTSSPTCAGAINVCAAEFANGTDQDATTVNFKSSN
jgi:hypothetical protein